MDNFVEETLAKYEMERVIADRKEAESAADPGDDSSVRQQTAQPAPTAQQSPKQDPRNNRFF